MTTTPAGAHGEVGDRVDVVVIGDGPAGSALARSCHLAGIEVVLIGDDAAWTSTYSTWTDDLSDPSLAGLLDVDAVVATSSPEVWAYGARAHRLGRTYATFDNALLQPALRDGVSHRIARATRVVATRVGNRDGHRVDLATGDAIRARVVVDATGWPARFARSGGTQAPAWQTALGVVLAEPPEGELGRPTFMDFRRVIGVDGAPSSVGPHGVTTFCYSLPMSDGWLVEETVLAARPAIEPIALLPRLAARLGRHPDSVLADAIRTEYVRIPLGGARPGPEQPIVAFGAAAGYVHAATGFSVAASIRAAPRVAAAIAEALASSSGVAEPGPIADAVWPAAMRRTRILHDHGLEVLLDLDDDDVRAFFDAFFDLPIEDWTAYLRVDAPPRAVSAVMARLFRSSSWQLRRHLAGRNPAALARLLRP
ncbi:MAG TPA: lycopene cyclase family protein [Ilumatobacteraceae bacterium]|nr:lycopene cyclase family protein [Ilumatobacteraceae bacterium]